MSFLFMGGQLHIQRKMIEILYPFHGFYITYLGFCSLLTRPKLAKSMLDLCVFKMWEASFVWICFNPATCKFQDAVSCIHISELSHPASHNLQMQNAGCRRIFERYALVNPQPASRISAKCEVRDVVCYVTQFACVHNPHPVNCGMRATERFE